MKPPGCWMARRTGPAPPGRSHMRATPRTVMKMEEVSEPREVNLRSAPPARTHQRPAALGRRAKRGKELLSGARTRKVGVTEAASVTTATVQVYNHAIVKFLKSAGVKEIPRDLEVLDTEVVRYFDEGYLEGRGSGGGSTLLAALHFEEARLVGRGCCLLPRAIRSLRGWQKLVPSQTQQPLPWKLCAAIAMSLLESKSVWAAAAWLLMVDCLLRPSECLRLRACQVLQPTSEFGMMKATLFLNPTEFGQRSKVGELDESVIIDRKWLSESIAALARCRRPHEALFNLDLAQMRACFVKAAHQCGIAQLRPVLYMGRHSGASIAALETRMTLDMIKKRGRWRTDASVRRYEKSGLVQKVWLGLAERDRKSCIRAAARLPGELDRHVQIELTRARRASRRPSLLSCSRAPVALARPSAGADMSAMPSTSCKAARVM